MNYQNQLSASISDSDLNEILDAITFINTKLPDLVLLSALERSALPKTSSDTINFIYENLKLADEAPELVPDCVDLAELRKDLALIKSIEKILVPLKDLSKKLEDSAVLAESEAYLPSIAIYNAVKADAIRKNHQKRTVKVG